MDPSIMKLLEDDEDESMHSGADVDAFTAALNRDIGGDPSTVSQSSGPETVGVLSQESASELKQLPEQWQASEDENPGQQNQQHEQKLHLQSSEQQSSQMEPKDQESSIKDQEESINSQPEQLQKGQPNSNHQQQETGQTSHQLVEKDRVEISEQDPVHNSQVDRPPSENQQQQTVQQLHSQQGSAGSDGDNSSRRMKPSPSIPFHMLIPILRPHLDKDRSMQLQSVFSKLRSNEVSKEDFLRVIRNIVGDQMLRQAAHKVQLQIQAQSARNSQTNLNQYSLQAQAASQQLSSRASQKLAETQVPASHPTSSSSSLQDHKGQKSPPRQPSIPSSSIQLQTDASFQTFDSSQKSQEVEHNFDGKGTHSTPIYSTNMNLVKSERKTSMASLQNTNKQQHAQPPQQSFSMYGSTGGNFHSHAFPRPTVSSAASSLKQQTQTPQMRQLPQTQGMVSMHLGTSKPMNTANVPKYDLQNAASETRRLHSGSLTNHPLSQKSPVVWPPLANKENDRAFPQIGHVKQEVVDQAAEPSQKFQFTASEGSSFSSMHIEHGNQNLGSMKDDGLEKQASRMGFSAPTSISGANPVSGAVTAQVDPTIQMHPQMSSTIPSLSGLPMRTPSKKISVGQKKPLETLGTSPPSSNKKQKTSGAFLDQSIDQLNDVTAVSGVNLREEEEQLLSAPKEESRASEATRRVVQEEEERLILHKGPLHKKLVDIMSQCGLEGIGGDVERCLSMCVEERLRGFISYLIRLSKQRADIEKTRHKYVITSDVRRQILLMNQKAKDEWDRKQAEEAEKHRKLNESENNAGADTDKEKDDGRSKNIKVNKEEDDKMRATAANVAARAAVGGDDMLSKWQLMAEQARQKREGLDGASSSQPSKTTNSKPMPGLGRNSREHQETQKKGSSAAAAGNGMTRKMGRHAATSQPKVACNISVKDVIAALEREPQMSKSTLIYRLYDRRGGGGGVNLQHNN